MANGNIWIKANKDHNMNNYKETDDIYGDYLLKNINRF